MFEEHACQAPKGGLVSPVNGQFYEGGQFMPVHGLFSGKKGMKRKKIWDEYDRRNCAIDLGGTKMFECMVQTGNVWDIIGVCCADSEKDARSAFEGKVVRHYGQKKYIHAKRI